MYQVRNTNLEKQLVPNTAPGSNHFRNNDWMKQMNEKVLYIAGKPTLAADIVAVTVEFDPKQTSCYLCE